MGTTTISPILPLELGLPLQGLQYGFYLFFKKRFIDLGQQMDSCDNHYMEWVFIYVRQKWISYHCTEEKRFNKIIVSKRNNLYTCILRLGLGAKNNEKKSLPGQKWPEQDRKILERCMHRSTYKPRTPSEDKVAVLWTRSPCYGACPPPTNPSM